MNIVMYSTGCPKCNVLEKKLNAANIEHEVCADEQKVFDVCTELQLNSLPILQVDDKYYTFSAAVKWVGEQ